MPLEFLKSQKGKPQLKNFGHVFGFHMTMLDGNQAWKCVKYEKFRCLAKIHTDAMDSAIIKELGTHNHATNAAQVSAKETVNLLRARSLDTQESPHQIVASVSAGLNQSIAPHMPSVSSMKRTAQRVRGRQNAPAPLPLSLEELEIPDHYSTTLAGEPFVLFDSGRETGDNCIIVFGTAANLRMLAQSRHWFCDGTFKMVPLLFDQLYTLHGLNNGSVLPAIYALLPNRQGTTYAQLFSQLKILQPTLDPESIMTEFELSAINSFTSEFPNSRQRGCFFHHNQCIWRKIQDFGLARRYETDPEFALQAKLLSALAFVPKNDVVQAFEILTDGGYLVGELEPVVDYFEDTWIGRRRRNGRRNPKFPVAMWNCYNAVMEGLAKTNNSCEGWHRGFLQLVGAEHPSIWNFIGHLKRDQSINELKIEQFVAGQPAAPIRKQYRDCAERIATIVNRYNNEWLNNGQQQGMIDYLRGLSHNYNF